MASSGNTWYKKLLAKQRKYALRHTKQRFAVEPDHDTSVKKVREYREVAMVQPIKPRRGRCVLSHEKRLAILNASEVRANARRAFFAELGVTV
jgi:hypothetical protein